MALSGTLNTNGYEGRYLQFSWTATQDIAGNKSTISWTLKGAGTGVSLWYKAGAFKVVIDGSTVYSTSESNRITLYNGTTVASGTKTINHNSDGTRSFAVSIQGGIWYYAPNCKGSTTFTLNTIPRASTFSVSSTSANIGSNVTFTINRASDAFTHKLTLTWGGKTSDIGTGIATSKTWTIPSSLSADLPNSTSSGCIITCITYNGSSEIGRKTLAMTLNVPATVKPSIGSVTISEAVSGLASKFGVYVQNKSKLRVSIASAGAQGSTIKSYSTKILGKTYSGSPFTSNALGSTGISKVEVTITDSRGRTASMTKSITVDGYSDPKITKFTAERCESNGTLSDEGEYVKLSFAFNITSLSDKNDKSYTIGYKLKEDSEYTTLTSGSAYSLNTTYISTTTFSGDNAYDFILTVTDYFGSVSNMADITTAFTLTDYHSSGTGVAFGKVSSKEKTLENALELNQVGNSYAFQASAFNGDPGYTLLASIKLIELNVNAPIVFVLNKRSMLCPMSVYIKFKGSSSTMDPDLESITYEGDNYGAFLVKTSTSTWSLYVDNTSGWSNPCIQTWYTTNNQMARMSVSFPQGQIETLPTPYYRATPAKLRSILDYIYPVGSIYLSYSHVSPADLFGGTWVRIKNSFLWACDEDGEIGVTGGEKTHVLTVNELPSHTHNISVANTATGTTAASNKIRYNNDSSSYVGNIATVTSGGGAAHNNMPPYIHVSVWRRTA